MSEDFVKINRHEYDRLVNKAGVTEEKLKEIKGAYDKDIEKEEKRHNEQMQNATKVSQKIRRKTFELLHAIREVHMDSISKLNALENELSDIISEEGV